MRTNEAEYWSKPLDKLVRASDPRTRPSFVHR